MSYPIAKCPALRAARVNSFGITLGLNFNARGQLALACTPKCLRDLPDHAMRGKKSCGRIAQLRRKQAISRGWIKER